MEEMQTTKQIGTDNNVQAIRDIVVIVNKAERDVIEKALAEWKIEGTFSPAEGDDTMLKLHIHDCRPEVVWYTAKYVGAQLEMVHMRNFINQHYIK